VTRATGIGSLPGDDIRTSVRQVRDLLGEEHLPYLPELPARGPGADMLGRTAGLLVDLTVDLQPSGWRFVDRPGHDADRIDALWRQDLDELAEAYDGYSGDLKLQVTGPWTLAGGIRLHRGEAAVSDPGAARDLVASLAEGVGLHLADVQRLVPGATLVLQVDEPSLPAVLDGSIPTSTGFGRLRPVDPQMAEAGLREVLGAAGERTTVVHCCHPSAPLPLLRDVGASAVAIDTTALNAARWESVATSVEEGQTLYAGCLPTDGSATVADAWRQLAEGWQRIGLALSDLDAIVVSPACGLAGLTPAGAWGVQRMATDVAREATERARS
jgi:hypothetical protein